MNRFSSYDTSFATANVAREASRSASRIGIALLCGVAAASGFLFGGFAGLNHASSRNHSRGACIALEFAENFGSIGATQKRQAMHAMATSAGQHQGLFPKTVPSFEELCARTWASEVRLGR